MKTRCDCHKVSTFAGEKAVRYANMYLSDVSKDDNGTRLLRCRVCGAFWEMTEDDLIEDEGRRVRLHRVRAPETFEDFVMPEVDTAE